MQTETYFYAEKELLLELLEELKDNPKKDEIMKLLAECDTIEEKIFYLIAFTSE